MSNKNQGQSLLEVLIALSVIILVITALVRVVTLSIRSTDYARKTSLASTYATEAMEKIRSFRDVMTWTNFIGLAGSTKFFGSGITTNVQYSASSNCPANIGSSDFSAYEASGSLIDGIFVRCSKLEYGGTDPTDYVKATVTVYWLENEEVKKSEIISYFYNWK